jgi:D-amino-acid oxidase
MMNEMTRRKWMHIGGSAAVNVLAAGCASRRRITRGALANLHPRKFQRVSVTPSRVIRTDVGLRPFRASGFVVRTERFGDKIIVHNYGHGGAGVSLSWGTAQLAVEQSLEQRHRSCAVLGCGAVGLATAILLRRSGFEVTIYARDLPPNTTSDVAGAQWAPSSLFQPGKTTTEFDRQMEKALHFSHRYFQSLVGDRYGVRWIENYSMNKNRPNDCPPPPDTDSSSRFFPDMRVLGEAENCFGAPFVCHFATMLIEPPIYLRAILRDFQIAGGRVRIQEFHNRDALLALPQSLIVNCLGLGSRQLFDDSELIPVKGQLIVLLPQPEIDYIIMDGNLYMFPRKDGILLGGTYEPGVEDISVNKQAFEEIFEGHRKFFGGMRS